MILDSSKRSTYYQTTKFAPAQAIPPFAPLGSYMDASAKGFRPQAVLIPPQQQQ